MRYGNVLTKVVTAVPNEGYLPPRLTAATCYGDQRQQQTAPRRYNECHNTIHAGLSNGQADGPDEMPTQQHFVTYVTLPDSGP